MYIQIPGGDKGIYMWKYDQKSTEETKTIAVPSKWTMVDYSVKLSEAVI
jgi:hypothetical protein